MIKRVAAVAAATAVLAGGTVLASTATAEANPGSPSCVTRAEFHKAHKGQTMKRVHRIFGIDGHQTSYYDGTYIPDSQSRDYHSCTSPRWSWVNVDFEKRHGVWVLDSKYAYWG